MFEKLGVRNNLIKLVKSNFSLYRIILICFFIYYEIKANSSVIPIDLESTVISMFALEDSDSFNQFIKDPFAIYSPNGKILSTTA